VAKTTVLACALVTLLFTAHKESEFRIFARAQLPDGPGRDTVMKVCGACHAPEQTAQLRQDRGAWQATIQKMSEMSDSGSLDATPEELNQVLEYLSKTFPQEAIQPLNLIKATAVELESVLGLLRKEAGAILEYRARKGPFKSIEDLKKVPGVDFKKIEAKKDRVIF